MDVQVLCSDDKAKCVSVPLTDDKPSFPPDNIIGIIPADTKIAVCADDNEICVGFNNDLIVAAGGTTLSKVCFNPDGSFKNSDIDPPWPISKKVGDEKLKDTFDGIKDQIKDLPNVLSVFDCFCK